eukprot:TRINITY_DN105617_c0_g1_i1.p1 TRINITY_DN105617_c0_g1~~TRINITY_DN105617_c0_g1_i1.p1  ORF type:complete len:329 (+),score=38.75 TRINITY_DN105617_c0_g1_i1:76-1062(+)
MRKSFLQNVGALFSSTSSSPDPTSAPSSVTPELLKAIAGSPNLVAYRAKVLFKEFDTNHNGEIERNELKAALVAMLQSLSLPLPSEAEVENVLMKFDSDHSGSLNEEQFAKWFTEFVAHQASAGKDARRAHSADSGRGYGGDAQSPNASGMNIVDAGHGFTALHEAASKGDSRQVEEYLKSRADVRVQSAAGYTPLACAVLGNQAATVRTLLYARSDVESTDNHGDRPLIHAVKHASADVVTELLRAGATPNCCGGDRELDFSPLHIAAQNSSKGPASPNALQIAEILLQAGANLNSENKSGYTPFAVAEDWGSAKCAEFFRSKGGHR